MNVGERLYEICRSRGITIKEVEIACGCGNGYINNMRKEGTIPKAARLKRLSEYLHVPEHVLLGEEEPQKAVIPVLGRVAAGLPITAVQNIIGQEEITPEMAASGEFFALKINGDSMSPNIHDGDVVIVRQQDDADEGDIVVAIVNGDDGVCKRLKKYAGGIILISDNPAYPPLIFTCSEIDTQPVRIIGRVVELRRTL